MMLAPGSPFSNRYSFAVNAFRTASCWITLSFFKIRLPSVAMIFGKVFVKVGGCRSIIMLKENVDVSREERDLSKIKLTSSVDESYHDHPTTHRSLLN